MAGLATTRQRQNRLLGFSITRPWLIELPRSLVDVVVSWNLSMHYWLKTCKFHLESIPNWFTRNKIFFFIFDSQMYSCNSYLTADSRLSYSRTSFHHCCTAWIFNCRLCCYHWALLPMPNTRFVKKWLRFSMHASWRMHAPNAHIGIVGAMCWWWHSTWDFAFWPCFTWPISEYCWMDLSKNPKLVHRFERFTNDGAI